MASNLKANHIRPNSSFSFTAFVIFLLYRSFCFFLLYCLLSSAFLFVFFLRLGRFPACFAKALHFVNHQLLGNCEIYVWVPIACANFQHANEPKYWHQRKWQRPSLLGWRPSLLSWRLSLVGWRPSLVVSSRVTRLFLLYQDLRGVRAERKTSYFFVCFVSKRQQRATPFSPNVAQMTTRMPKQVF